jgi:hypothetical protein
VYAGQFRVVPREVVLADIRQQVAAGAQHITFGDPDFFNGVTHATRIVDGLHQEFPRLTYDVTIKIEHLLRHSDALPALGARIVSSLPAPSNLSTMKSFASWTKVTRGPIFFTLWTSARNQA